MRPSKEATFAGTGFQCRSECRQTVSHSWIVLGESVFVDVVDLAVQPATNQDFIYEGARRFAVGVCPRQVGYFGGSIDHGMAGRVGPLSLLDVVPVFNNEVALNWKTSKPILELAKSYSVWAKT